MEGANINIVINDISGSGNAANALKGLQDFLRVIFYFVIKTSPYQLLANQMASKI